MRMKLAAFVIVMAGLLVGCGGGNPAGPDRVEHRQRAHPKGQNPTPPPFVSSHPHLPRQSPLPSCPFGEVWNGTKCAPPWLPTPSPIPIPSH